MARNRRLTGWTSLVVLAAAVVVVWAAGGDAPVSGKKLIEYGGGARTPSVVAERADVLQGRPLDGMVMYLPQASNVFSGERADEQVVAAEIEALRGIEWTTFTDNFIILHATSKMDWFSDADWEIVTHNLRLCAVAASEGGLRGLCLDPEPYGADPWHYPGQPHAGEKSWDEYQQQVRTRGAQFMDTIEAEMEKPVLMTLFLLSYFRELLTEPDAAEQQRQLSEHYYGLIPAFVNGLLDAVDPETVITDGNEPSYYYFDKLGYMQAYHLMKQSALSLVAPENQARYRAQVQASQALYVDHVFNLRMEKFASALLSAEQRAELFEHNTYWALRTSDQYAWIYGEGIRWWMDDDLPPGIEQAIANGKRTLASGKRCEIRMRQTMLDARNAIIAEQRESERRTATVELLPEGAAPQIDGDLGDAAWQEATQLEEFMAPRVWNRELVGATLAWVAYDSTNLYVAVRCDEPAMQHIRVEGEARDDDVFLGDTVELLIEPVGAGEDFYHLAVNPDGVVWDAVQTGRPFDASWDPEWRVATSAADDHWAVEAAIPWKEIGVTPEAGQALGANICRQRAPGRNEISSWSQCVRGFVEPSGRRKA